ncbi:MAG: cytochrome c3 family protein [Proteobacteria bacterium]|nr:cytochrome c3 family protein [Pseudomonadota bacterium]
MQRTLLLGFMAAMPVTVLPSPADVVPAVPDNIAPHPAPAQPLPFSHKTHLAIGPTCQTCHLGPDPGIQMTFPATEICLSCHRMAAKDKPAIMDLQEFSKSGQRIPWLRVYAITPGVSWSHRVHLDAGMQCETCHGDMKQIETVAETKAIVAMATCIGCHQAVATSTKCVTCHAWPTDQVLGFD